ncbi:MAG: sulfite exporter TauE/SafE family protein [Candidatus Bathyarchaeia archaeon]
MSLIPEVSNPFLAAFAGGLLYGLAVCTASCLPYLASYIAGVGAGFRRSIKITAIFNSGRILAYALIGSLVGLFSGLFRLALSGSATSPFQTYSAIGFGVLSIAIGTSIIIKSRAPCECTPKDTKKLAEPTKMGRFGFDYKAFTLGLGRGLILCPPLVALLVYSLPFSTPLGSVGLAVLFGLGTALSPMLLLGGVTGWLLNKAPLLRMWISIGGAAVLILLGIVALVNALI